MLVRCLSSFLTIFLLVLPHLNAQDNSEDPVLFTVGNDKVHISEFKYVYEKSNGASADFSEASLDEFLELYKKFKLKVADAKAQGLNDDPALQEELNHYREQLANNYMSDKAVLDNLTRELYERKKEEVDVSHILIRIPENAPEALIKNVRDRLMMAKNALAEGLPFSTVAKRFSQDQSVTSNGGHLGYRYAKLPNGFYDLETAMYETPVGQISEPVESSLGLHIIKVEGKRPARGEMTIRHILARTGRSSRTDTSKQKIDRIYSLLEEGADFQQLAKKYSEDKNTNHKGGMLGAFTTGTFAPEFEDVAFTISQDGGYSLPVKTEYGWHIIQRVKLDTLDSYAMEKDYLENIIQNDYRFQIAQKALVNKIKTKENYQIGDITASDLLEVFSEDVFKLKWDAPEVSKNPVLFSIQDKEYRLKDLSTYLQKNRNARYQTRAVRNPEEAMQEIFDAYIDREVLEFEKAHLEENYPEFKEIMREYREGIMLFEVSKERIWDKAGSDTVGLKNYYEDHKSEYYSPRDITVSKFTINSTDERVIEKVAKRIRKKSPEKVLKKLNKAAKVISYDKMEMKENELKEEYFADKELSIGDMDMIKDAEKGSTTVLKIQEVGKAMPLKFQEAKGEVMSDYQIFLEEDWIAELKSKYEVDVNENVFQSLVKS
ncbi:peptidylprolyl isomerase [Membranihabitans maritimus]|uniref:peptidylprolyl isomerase n=1 Tax=Membranihabitans maritimus TaxID=2904244 RepID=UPI001F005BD6|nr:peptidylprolyl isomerase [Membranihabitans maritimus]